MRKIIFTATIVFIFVIWIGVKLVYDQAMMPFSGKYDYSWLRSVDLTITGDLSKVIKQLEPWATQRGYEFRNESKLFDGGHVSVLVWRGDLIIWGVNGINKGDVEFAIYWNGDFPDEKLIGEIAGQLNAYLLEFGSVKVLSAPPGTRARTESPPFQRER